MRVKEESEKNWLKAQRSKSKDHGIWSHQFMANRGEKMDTVTDLIFLGFKITADSDCSHEIRRCLLLVRKALINLSSILKKQRHHFANKGLYSQSYGFSSSQSCINVRGKL